MNSENMDSKLRRDVAEVSNASELKTGEWCELNIRGLK